MGYDATAVDRGHYHGRVAFSAERGVSCICPWIIIYDGFPRSRNHVIICKLAAIVMEDLSRATLGICMSCNEDPCLWVQHSDQILRGCQEDSNGATRSNNECRYYCYRHFTRQIHGCLGKGNRVDLPKCVKNMIKDTFPDEKEVYTGFKRS